MDSKEAEKEAKEREKQEALDKKCQQELADKKKAGSTG